MHEIYETDNERRQDFAEATGLRPRAENSQ